jgi:hypothetical protein
MHLLAVVIAAVLSTHKDGGRKQVLEMGAIS